MFSDIWNRLTSVFRHVPANWKILDGDETDGPYVHGTSVLALCFSPDDSLLALAGGGMLPHADPTIRLIDPVTGKNVRTLLGHTCGIHDLSFDSETGLLASASYDYSICLWDLNEEDVIFLLGADQKTKGHSQFTPDGSLLAIGEYDCYEGPHSLHIYDLARRRMVFRHSLPDEQGITALAVSPDSRYVAFTTGNQDDSNSARLGLFDTRKSRIVLDRAVKGFSFYDIAYVEHDAILAGVTGRVFGDFQAGLILIDLKSGTVKWKEKLGGVRVTLAVHPSQEHVAFGFESDELRFYRTSDWTISGSHPFKRFGAEHVCSLAFTHEGDRLAYGTSAGTFDIVEFAG